MELPNPRTRQVRRAAQPYVTAAAVVESNLLKVSTRPSLTYEGGAVRTTIRVGRDWRNGVLRLSIDGERFGASSEFWLEGADAAIVYERLWLTLPDGIYEVRVTVERNDGSTKAARAHFQVTGESRR